MVISLDYVKHLIKAVISDNQTWFLKCPEIKRYVTWRKLKTVVDWEKWKQNHDFRDEDDLEEENQDMEVQTLKILKESMYK